MQITDKHILFTTSNDIYEICKPLFEAYGITYFGYMRVYRDGSRTKLTTHPTKCKYELETDYVESTDYNAQLIMPKQSIVLWNDGENFLPDQSKHLIRKKIADSRKYFNVDHGIAIVEGHGEYCDSFNFATSGDNSAILEFYFSNFDILRLFVLYFKDKAQKLIELTNKNKIIMPRSTQLKPPQNITSDMLAKKMAFMSKIKPSRYLLNAGTNSIFLTEKQVCCLSLLAMGKTAKQAAKFLNISYKTVEYHIETIKGKLQCETLDQLLNIFWDSPLHSLRKEILDLSQEKTEA